MKSACLINLDIVDIEKILRESIFLKSVSKIKIAMQQKVVSKGILNLARIIKQRGDVNLKLTVLTSMVSKMFKKPKPKMT